MRSRNDHLPFASADSIALDRSAAGQYETAHRATSAPAGIRRAGAARVGAPEMLMREHAVVGFRYGPLFGAPG